MKLLDQAFRAVLKVPKAAMLKEKRRAKHRAGRKRRSGPEFLWR
jgi:hypothetical protein